MSLLPPIYDCFGRRYTLLTSGHNAPHPALRAEKFSGTLQARRFIGQLKTPVSFWRKVYLNSSTSSRIVSDDRQLTGLLAEMLYRGRIRVYQVDSINANSSKNLAFTDTDKTSYAIKPVNFLLLHRLPEIKTFREQKEALAFVAKSGATDEELTKLLSKHNLDTAPDSKTAAAQALVAGDLIVTVSRYTQPPTPDPSAFLAEPVIDKLAGLGPPASDPDLKLLSVTRNIAEDGYGDIDHSAYLSENGDVPDNIGFPEINVTTKINGNEVAGIAKPVGIRVGDPNKVAIIGRSMDAVEPYADTLRAQGLDVNVFSSADLTVPTYARKQWDLLRTQYNGRIPDHILPETQMFKANEGWAELIKYDKSTVINIGNPFNQGDSLFFNMEQQIIFGK